jgi:hypothetical protein
MAKENSEFWKIMEANFSVAQHDHCIEIQSDLQQMQKKEASNNEHLSGEGFNKVVNASNDPMIAHFFVDGAGSEESLIAYLQRSYDITETEALSAIDWGIGKLHEITDYGEA